MMTCQETRLDSEQVKLARCEEMEEVKKHEVYVKVPIQQCFQETGKAPIWDKMGRHQ